MSTCCFLTSSAVLLPIYATHIGKQDCLHHHPALNVVKAPTTFQVSLFYMNTGSFSRGNENLCQPRKSAKRTQQALGADKTALSIKVA